MLKLESAAPNACGEGPPLGGPYTRRARMSGLPIKSPDKKNRDAREARREKFRRALHETAAGRRVCPSTLRRAGGRIDRREGR